MQNYRADQIRAFLAYEFPEPGRCEDCITNRYVCRDCSDDHRHWMEFRDAALIFWRALGDWTFTAPGATEGRP